MAINRVDSNFVENRSTGKTVREEIDNHETNMSERGVNVITPPPPYSPAKADGIADDTSIINSLLSNFLNVFLPVGKYLITSEIIMPNRSRLYGVGGSWSHTQKSSTVLVWGGETSDDKAVIRVSTAKVGTEPTSAKTNIRIKDIVLDGSGNIGYGLYTAYATNDSRFENITAMNTTQHAIRIEKSWYASYRDLTVRSNFGCGITIGKENWGGVNGVYFSNLRAHNNGRDLAFNESTNIEWGYGVGIYNGSSLIVRGITSEQNDGAGIVFRNLSTISGVDGAYMEGNNKRTGTYYGVIYLGNTAGRNHFFNNIYLAGTINDEDAQYFWLTGNKPNAGKAVRIDTIANGRLKADWSNYELVNAAYTITDYIEGHIPSNPNTVGYNLDTLYVRSSGDDNNDGRTVSNAFRSLTMAIRRAKNANRVTTIDCSGADLMDEVLDLDNFNRDITIIGDGTATINNSSSGASAIIINNAQSLVYLDGFDSISRIEVNNCRQVRIDNTNIIKTDPHNNAVLISRSSNVMLFNCLLTDNNGGATYSRGVELYYSSKLVLMQASTSNFFSDRHFNIYQGSEIDSNTWLSSFDNSTRFMNNTGVIRGNNKIRMSGGSITLS